MSAKIPQPEAFEAAPTGELTVRQQVSRCNLPLETKAIVLAALDKPPPPDRRSPIYKAVQARVSDCRKLTNTTLEELEKVVQDALRATVMRIASEKVYRENGKLWKVRPRKFLEPDHIMRLRVLEIFMKQPPNGSKPKKSTKTEEATAPVSRLRDREESLESSQVDGNGDR